MIFWFKIMHEIDFRSIFGSLNTIICYISQNRKTERSDLVQNTIAAFMIFFSELIATHSNGDDNVFNSKCIRGTITEVCKVILFHELETGKGNSYFRQLLIHQRGLMYYIPLVQCRKLISILSRNL